MTFAGKRVLITQAQDFMGPALAEVFNRTDDDGPPPDLPARTQTIADEHGWGKNDKAAG